MKLLCKLFGHREMYYVLDDKNFRLCPACKRLQVYKSFDGRNYHWVDLVGRTRQGADKWIARNNINKE